MKVTDVLGCTDNDDAYCLAHCPNKEQCEWEHGAIFVGSEWNCPGPSCDVCLNRIEGMTLLHYGHCDIGHT